MLSDGPFRMPSELSYLIWRPPQALRRPWASRRVLSVVSQSMHLSVMETPYLSWHVVLRERLVSFLQETFDHYSGNGAVSGNNLVDHLFHDERLFFDGFSQNCHGCNRP